MRGIFTADWHIHPYRECSRDNGSDRLQHGLSAVRQCFAYAEKYSCPLYFGGDIKMYAKLWPQEALNGLLDIFKDFSFIKTMMFSGNAFHDGQNGDGVTGLRPFYSISKVIERPEVALSLDTMEPITVWPWQPSTELLPGLMAKSQEYESRLLFGHGFINGVRVGPLDVRLPTQGIPAEAFALERGMFDWAFFGDIHKKQSLQFGKTVLWYCGSPYAQNWGEQEQDKGCLFFDTEQGVVTELTIDAPVFRELNWTKPNPPTDPSDDGLEVVAEALSTGSLSWAGDFVKLVVGPWANSKLLQEIQAASKAAFFKVMVLREENSAKRSDIHAGLSIDEILSQYVDTHPIQGIENSSILRAGKMLYSPPQQTQQEVA